MNEANIIQKRDELISEVLKVGKLDPIDKQFLSDIKTICHCQSNKSGIRLILAASLAKSCSNDYDIRQPYTEIGGKKTYSGRYFDENFIAPIITQYALPCNQTTAFLTPALRNINSTLDRTHKFVGRPADMYDAMIKLLNDVEEDKLSAKLLFQFTILTLLQIRDENQNRVNSLISKLSITTNPTLTTDRIVQILQSHINAPGASRLPVLIIAAAYNASQDYLKEKIIPLQNHNAADNQTGSLGDIEITLINDERIITTYEMKLRKVEKKDIDIGLRKISESEHAVENYIFVTTDTIDSEVEEYAKSISDKTRGIEFAILDCISFIKYYLHLFYRIRIKYLDEYQRLVLAEPDSAIDQSLKELFLALRLQAESFDPESVAE